MPLSDEQWMSIQPTHSIIICILFLLNEINAMFFLTHFSGTIMDPLVRSM